MKSFFQNSNLKRVVFLISFLAFLTDSQGQWINIPDSNFGEWAYQLHPDCMQYDPVTKYKMDTSCIAAYHDTFLYGFSTPTRSLEGIQYFKSITHLQIHASNIDTYPNLPATLLKFEFASAALTSFPSLPEGLVELDCSGSGITHLNKLPHSLKILNCSTASIQDIDSLPQGLNFMWCAGNFIHQLPALPQSLLLLDCQANLIPFLPALPGGMQKLNCSSNQLTSLPQLPSGLRYLDINSNTIQTLPALPDSLSYFDCSRNTGITCTALPQFIQTFLCNQNQLNVLPALPASIVTFECYGNNLVELSANSILSKLDRLLCMSNPLLRCLPPLPAHLNTFYFDNPLLTCLPNHVTATFYLNDPSVLPVCTSSIATCLYGNRLFGKVYADFNSDCVFNTGDHPFSHKVVTLDQGAQITITDSFGNYSFFTDSGLHRISVSEFPYFYQAACGDTFRIVTFNGHDALDSLDFRVVASVSCHSMLVDIANNGYVRPCRMANYDIYYQNLGSDVAPAAYIDIQFDPKLIPLSASSAYTNLGNNIWRFILGDIAPFQSGTLHIADSVSCNTIIGEAITVNAQANPIPTCLQYTSNWDSSHVICSARWSPGQDSVSMVAINKGKVMTGSIPVRIYEEELLMFQIPVTLGTADSFVFRVPANGHTYRIEADQRPGHPGMSKPRDFIEMAGGPPFILHHIITVPQDDADNWVEIDGHEICDSYDPNDKVVIPAGVGPQHLIAKDDDLEYIIRFQNTGNASANDVVIIDTLDFNHLDLASFSSVIASHPFDVTMQGRGVVKWTFHNIMLPDSQTNEEGSHGYVKYKIRQRLNNPVGSVIQNTAEIYFDHNAPVRTPTTFVTIERKEVIFPLSIKSLTASTGYLINAYPNPFDQVIQFQISSSSGNDGFEFQLFDLTGSKIIFRDVAAHFELSRNEISEGYYIFKLFQNGKVIGNGKLVVR